MYIVASIFNALFVQSIGQLKYVETWSETKQLWKDFVQIYTYFVFMLWQDWFIDQFLLSDNKSIKSVLFIS